MFASKKPNTKQPENPKKLAQVEYLLKTHQREKAKKSLEELIASHPNKDQSFQILVTLGKIHKELFEEDELDHDHQLALSYFKKAKSLNANHLEIKMLIATQLFHKNPSDSEALLIKNMLNDRSEKNPEDPLIHYYLGLCELAAKNYQHAFKKFKKAYKLRMDSGQFYFHYAFLCSHFPKKFLKDAWKFIKKAESSGFSSSQFYLLFAHLSRQKKEDYAFIISLYNKAIVIDKKNLFFLGKFYLDNRQNDLASDAFFKALETNLTPDREYECLIQLARYNAVININKAFSYADRANKIKMNTMLYFETIVFIYQNNSLLQNAENFFKSSLETETLHRMIQALLYVILGNIYRQKKDLEKSKEAYIMSSKLLISDESGANDSTEHLLQPKDRNIILNYYVVGLTLMQAKEYEKAIECFSKSLIENKKYYLENSPGHIKTSYHNRYVCYENLNFFYKAACYLYEKKTPFNQIKDQRYIPILELLEKMDRLRRNSDYHLVEARQQYNIIQSQINHYLLEMKSKDFAPLLNPVPSLRDLSFKFFNINQNKFFSVFKMKKKLIAAMLEKGKTMKFSKKINENLRAGLFALETMDINDLPKTLLDDLPLSFISYLKNKLIEMERMSVNRLSPNLIKKLPNSLKEGLMQALKKMKPFNIKALPAELMDTVSLSIKNELIAELNKIEKMEAMEESNNNFNKLPVDLKDQMKEKEIEGSLYEKTDFYDYVPVSMRIN